MANTQKQQLVLTTIGAAKVLRCSPRTLEDWRLKRKGPVYLKRSDKRNVVYYDPADVHDFAVSHARGPLKPKSRKAK